MSINAIGEIFVGWNFEIMKTSEVEEVIELYYDEIDDGIGEIEYIYQFDKTVGLGIVVDQIDAYDGLIKFNLVDLRDDILTYVNGFQIKSKELTEMEGFSVWQLADFR